MQRRVGACSLLVPFLASAASAALVAFSACGDHSVAGGHVERWDTLWSYRTTLEDTVLLTPSWLATFRDGVVVGDGNTPRVTAFGADGEVRWIYAPPRGEGPGEMRYAVDAIDTDEGLWVLAYPPRLILLSERGALLRHLSITPAPTGVSLQIEPWKDHEALLDVGRGLARVSLVDGRVVGDALPIPWIRQPPGDWIGSVSLAVHKDLIAVGMTYGPEVLILHGDSLRGAVVRPEITYRVRGRRVDSGNMYMFLEPSGQIPFGAWALSLIDSELWVLTGGAWLNDRVGVEEQRLNDRLLVYSVDGALIRERALPFDTHDIAVSGRRVYMLSNPLGDDDHHVLLALERG